MMHVEWSVKEYAHVSLVIFKINNLAYSFREQHLWETYQRYIVFRSQ